MTEPYHRDTRSYHRDTRSYRRDTRSHHRDRQSYRRDTRSYRRDTRSYRRDTRSYHRDTQPYHRDTRSYHRDRQSCGHDMRSCHRVEWGFINRHTGTWTSCGSTPPATNKHSSRRARSSATRGWTCSSTTTSFVFSIRSSGRSRANRSPPQNAAL